MSVKQTIYDMAKEIVESKSGWYGGESVTICEKGTVKVEIVNTGVDRDLLNLKMYNSSNKVASGVETGCGHLNPSNGWVWIMTRSSYARWAETARAMAKN
jgi:hypothetical protein